jgi:hypothetical protein
MNKASKVFRDLMEKFKVTPEDLGVKLTSEIKLSAEAKLQDGTMIYSTADAWAVGVDIYSMDPDGNPIQVQPGEYMLEDGTTLVVGDDNMVKEIKTPDMGAEMSAEVENFIKELVEKITEVQAKNTELSAALEAERAKYNTELSAVKTELANLKKAPATTSVKDTKAVNMGKEKTAPVKPFSAMSLRERIEYNLSNK